MLRLPGGWLAGGALAMCCWLAHESHLFAAAPTPAERTLVRTAEAALKLAGNLYRSKKYQPAADALHDAQTSLDQLGHGESPELAPLVASLEKRLAKARELLEKEGISVARPKTSPLEAKRQVSFTKQVAPVLTARCGGCHIQRSRGEFNMSTYAALSRGSKEGTVILPGNAKGSRMVEVIESGDMPRGGGKVSPEELSLLVSWIDAGAKFDGPDSAAPLSSFSAQTKPSAVAQVHVTAASPDDEVQFARDIGPLLVAHCLDCHGLENPRNQFSVETFSRLLKGGDNGVVVVPRKPAESLLIRKLRGQDGARMPKDRDPLAEEAIGRIEKWIVLGAKFDGADPEATLEATVSLAKARLATHESLSDSRAQLALKNWRLILPDARSEFEQTENVVVYGDFSKETLVEAAHVADEQVARLRKLFKVPPDKPFVKGRVTLFLFDKRYDYGEVGTMLEHREIPAAWRGHWHYTGVDAYGCVLLGENLEMPAGLIAQQLAGVYIASLGKVPAWFAEGTARTVATRMEPKSGRVKLWDDQVTRILRASVEPDSFLSGRLPPEDAAILSYSYVKFLWGSATRYAALLAAVEQGTAFEPAFDKAFGGTPSQLTVTWAARMTKGGGR